MNRQIWVDITHGNDISGTGTEAAPFKTIQKASDTTVPGDIVMIKPGIYGESITVNHTGSADATITYVAALRHGVIITGNGQDVPLMVPNGFVDAPEGGPVKHIHVKGIVFTDSMNADPVKGSSGWCFEDCVFKNGGGLMLRGGDSHITRCLFEDTLTNGVTAVFGHFTFKDCIIRRANRRAFSPGGFAGASKILITKDLMVDGVISYDNYGTGWWMDWDNINFTVRNCTIFGNHAGETDEFGKRMYQAWSAHGILTEGNAGPGLIENNVIHSNDTSGVSLQESGFKKAITVRNNILIGNGSGIEIRGMNRGIHDGIQYKIGKARIEGNLFKNRWAEAYSSCFSYDAEEKENANESIINAPERYWLKIHNTYLEQYETIHSDKPAEMGIHLNGNTYDRSLAMEGAPLFGWRSCDAVAKKPGTAITAHSLEELRQRFGLEFDGRMADIETIPASERISTYDLTLGEVSDPQKMRQVPSGEAESNHIDKALATVNAKVNDTVTIPVYGRLRGIEQIGATYVFDIYDLQARHVKVTVDESSKRFLEQAVMPYARLIPYHLTIKLTRKDQDGYTLEGIFPA